MKQTFESPFVGKSLRETVRNPNIIAGRHSYYSGYYHGHSFDDCARFLSSEQRDDVDRLLVGAFVSIASGVAFFMAGNQGHRHDWVSTFPFHYWDDFQVARDGWQPAGDTVVGNDVWIGSEAKIMSGITIGDGAVIAAGTVITKDVDPYAIVGGNPSKPIRFRFSPNDIEHLLEMQWWDWSDDDIRRALPYLTSGDVGSLFEFWKSGIR